MSEEDYEAELREAKSNLEAAQAKYDALKAKCEETEKVWRAAQEVHVKATQDYNDSTTSDDGDLQQRLWDEVQKDQLEEDRTRDEYFEASRELQTAELELNSAQLHYNDAERNASVNR
ncbi:MAG: hypothetical protein IIY58_01345 [Aeriscardovia sp.]|nr:hypothetical protein [Aeriscardovia sp.]